MISILIVVLLALTGFFVYSEHKRDKRYREEDGS